MDATSIMAHGPTGSWTLVHDNEFAELTSLPSEWHPSSFENNPETAVKGWGAEYFTGSQVTMASDGVHLTWDPSTGHSGCINSSSQSGGSAGFYVDLMKKAVIEIAVTIPSGNGWWPAFWGGGGGSGSYPWPPEKDWFEGGLGGAGTSQSLDWHYQQGTNGVADHAIGGSVANVTGGEELVYTVEMTPSADTWYVNGVQKATADPTTVDADFASNGAPSMYVILDLQVGSLAGATPSQSGTMIVRYFRAWD